MDVRLRLRNLPEMHSHLLWDTIIPATAAVLGETGATAPYSVGLTIQDVPGFGSGKMRLLLDPGRLSPDRLAKLKRTYEPSRMVEMAAIAVAGLALHHTGGHEIVDLALRGSRADYLVDEGRLLLEIAGRSRHVDFEAAWQQKEQRLAKRGGGFYVCVTEFETPAARLAFFA